MAPEQRLILYVDDDVDDQFLLHEGIRTIDPSIRIVAAENGYEALRYLNFAQPEDKPCLIIMDINMPLMDGKETLIYLKNEVRFSSIPVVIFTTSSSAVDKIFCKHYEAAFMTKPLAHDQLAGVIKEMLCCCEYCRLSVC